MKESMYIKTDKMNRKEITANNVAELIYFSALYWIGPQRSTILSSLSKKSSDLAEISHTD